MFILAVQTGRSFKTYAPIREGKVFLQNTGNYSWSKKTMERKWARTTTEWVRFVALWREICHEPHKRQTLNHKQIRGLTSPCQSRKKRANGRTSNLHLTDVKIQINQSIRLTVETQYPVPSFPGLRSLVNARKPLLKDLQPVIRLN